MIEIFGRNKLLQQFDDQSLGTVIPELERITLKAGAVLFSAGDPGDSAYVIETGTIRISTNDLPLNELGAGEIFGEMSLLNNQPRTASASAQTDATLIRVSRRGFLRLLDIQPDLADHLTRAMQALMRHSLLATALRRICGTLDETTLRAIEEEFRWETYAPGDVILRQGEEGEDALVIVSGRVRATLNGGDQERVLGEVGSGTIVGEMSLLSHAPRSATVTAVRKTRIARMNRSILTRITHAHPEFALNLMKTLVERQQRNADQNYVEKPSSLNIAIVPAQPGVDTRAFTQQLARYLERHGSTLVIDRRQFDELYGLKGALDETHPASVIVQLWLDELERAYDYVLYLTDDTWSNWTNWVTHAADRVLLIGEASGSPAPGALERSIAEHVTQQHHELVILHEPETERPSGTLRWLEARSIQRHHHIRKGDGAHFARLARLLTGNGIGLVLSGGGARGYAHIGVIKALMEAQVPIDAIGATSMGSVIGGTLLVYMKYESIRQKAQRLGSRKAILDFTIPVAALMRSKKVSDIVTELYGDFRIEDAWLPFFCISTNLSRASMTVHRSGRLADAVRASMSIPGVFTPVVREGDLLVDGGVMNNFPVDIMRSFLEGGHIIGALISGGEGKSRPYMIDDHINGWQTFLRNIVPGMKRKRVPSILKVILGATSVHSSQRIAEFRQRTDFLLQTDAHPYGMLDFDKHAELTQRGYETHLDAVRRWAQTHAALIDQPPLWDALDD